MLNSDLLKSAWKKIDELVDWVKITGKPIIGNALELADNWAGPYGLALANEKFGDRIPVELVPAIETALQAFVDGNYEGVLSALPDGIDSYVDVKQFDDEFEAQFFKVNFEAIIQLIKYYSKSKSS